MDIDMPVKNGIEATEEIRLYFKNKNLHSIKIIACTAFNNDIYVEKCLNAGMCEFMPKPIQKKSLEEALLTWYGDPYPD